MSFEDGMNCVEAPQDNKKDPCHEEHFVKRQRTSKTSAAVPRWIIAVPVR
jgi:hypothetical protein